MLLVRTDRMAAQARNVMAALASADVHSVVLQRSSVSRKKQSNEPSFVVNARIEAALQQAAMVFATVRHTMYKNNLLQSTTRRKIV